MKKRLLAMVLTVAMCLSLLPVSALAAPPQSSRLTAPTKDQVVEILNREEAKRVEVYCITEDDHDSEDYAVTKGSIESISEPYFWYGWYYCTVTISATDYIAKYATETDNGDAYGLHEALSNTKTLTLWYDSFAQNWKAFDSSAVSFAVRCTQSTTPTPNPDTYPIYPIYVYAKVVDSAGGVIVGNDKNVGVLHGKDAVQAEVNALGWITLGKISDATIVNPNTYSAYNRTALPGKDLQKDHVDIYNAIVNAGTSAALENYTGNKGLDTSNVSTWEVVTANGATDYNDVSSSTITWHMDGKIVAYKVTYDANGGTGTYSASDYYLNGASATVEENMFTAPAGKEFAGWNTQADGKGTTYNTANKTFTITSDVTLYAQWTANDYTIKYYLDGTEQTYLGETHKYGESVTAAALPTITGKTVRGWYTESTDPGVDATEASIPTMMPAQDLVYYAYSSDTAYTVKYDLNYEGATGAPADKTNVKWNDTGLLAADPTRDGWSFDGWFTDATDGTKVTNSTKYSDLAKTDTVKSVTLYAHWTKNAPTTVTVTFDANGGTWSALSEGSKYTLDTDKDKATQDVLKYSKPDVVAPEPTREGYDFDGWYLNDDKLILSFVPVQNKDITLVAHWKETGSQPTTNVNYNVTQHYVGVDGKDVHTVDIKNLSAAPGTPISSLIGPDYAKDLTDFGSQTYIYVAADTKVDAAPLAEQTLTGGETIHLYYYLDAWKDADKTEDPNDEDSLYGGDGTPDYQQAVVNFLADPNGTVGKTGEKTLQVFTLDKGADGRYSKSVTPTTVTPVPNEDFAFDIWTKDADEVGIDPFKAQTLNGGDNITYMAHFATDVKGGPDGNESDGTPDKYQATVTYQVVNGTWSDKTTEAQTEVFTLKTYTDGTWVDVTPIPTLGTTIPTNMIANSGHTGGSWNVAIAADTRVTADATYIYSFIPIGSVSFDPDDIYGKGEGEATALITKKLEGKVSGSYSEQFSVTLTKTSGADSVTYPKTGTTEKMTGTGTSAFVFNDVITFTAPGTYVFSVQETKGSTSYVTYDTNKYTLTIVVEEDNSEYTNGDPTSDKFEVVSGKQLKVTNWYFSKDEAQTLTITNTASYSSGGGGGGSHTKYTLTYETNGGKEIAPTSHVKNTVVQLDKVPNRENYTFTGWYSDKELTKKITEIKMTSDKTVYAGWEATEVPGMLNGDDHFAYVIGYPGGDVEPMGNITRAEVATIFFRLLKDDIRDGNLTSTNVFTDVNAGDWFNTAISTMAKLGIVNGRSADTFAPNAPITRAEFATICARFDTSIDMGASNFTDLTGHWAKDDIEHAVSLGWIMGYEDNTFRPNNLITRAEAMTMINRVLCRMPEAPADLLSDMTTWPDNMDTSKWYYLAIQEATNSHDFKKKGEVYETWTKLTQNPDWSRYQ